MKKINQNKVIELKVEGARLSNYYLDTFIAPKLSSLTECKARDASGLVNPWLINFILNSTFRVNVLEPTKTYLFNFLRRSEGAFMEYENARKELEDYINTRRKNPERNKISPYFRSLLHFESFIAQSFQAYLFLETALKEDFKSKGEEKKFKKIQTQLKEKLFNKDVGKIIKKLETLYLYSRHMDSKIEQRSIPTKSTTAIWITKNGLECKKAKVTFEELYKFLGELSKLASRISSIDINE